MGEGQDARVEEGKQIEPGLSSLKRARKDRQKGKRDRGFTEVLKTKESKRPDSECGKSSKGGFKAGGSRFVVLGNVEGTEFEDGFVQNNLNQKVILSDITNSKLKNKNKRVKKGGEESKKSSTSKGKFVVRLKDKMCEDIVALDKGIKEHIKHPVKFSIPNKGVVTSVKGKSGGNDKDGFECQWIQEKTINNKSNKGKLQYFFKKPLDLVDEEDNILDDPRVLQQLHKDVISYKGIITSNSEDIEPGGDTTMEP
ncbi:hypothetical protein ACOSQ2_031985 [Xanthoceras sorbifolium]